MHLPLPIGLILILGAVSAIAQETEVVVDQAACDKIGLARYTCGNGFENALLKGRVAYPSAELDGHLKALANCLCDIYAPYPDVASFPCPDAFGGLAEFYPRFKQACSDGAYNNVLIARHHVLVIWNYDDVNNPNPEMIRSQEYHPPYKNANGEVVSGSNVPLISGAPRLATFAGPVMISLAAVCSVAAHLVM
ncbi:hypothetical protein BC832DRAFT_621957 [Gaertneriomyces semiglobifer]|nr:hypothetical protein BC832DRAFT_621957 [Gaertneriomyces semiglobifer]